MAPSKKTPSSPLKKALIQKPSVLTQKKGTYQNIKFCSTKLHFIPIKCLKLQ